jgi:hypothetical protein
MKTVATKPSGAKAAVEVPALTSDLAIIKRDPAVLAASSGTPPIRRKIDSLAVTDQKSSEAMTDLIAQCIRVFKTTEAIRKRFVDPLNEHVKFINSFFKKITGPAQEAEDAGRTKLNTYLREEKRRADERVRIDAEAYEHQFAKAEQKAAKTGNAFVPPPEPGAVSYQAGVQTESAAAATRMVPKFKLAAKIDDVDPEYLMLDEAKIRRVVKAGIRQIKGLTIWEEPEAAIYT